MRSIRKLALGASMLTLAVALVGSAGVGAQSPTVKIGSDGFYESKLMAEIYAQVLEANGYAVERNLGLGPRPDRVPVFEGGQVDLVPEYVGSGLGFYTPGAQTADGEANRVALQAVFDGKDHLATVLAISPGQDNNAAAVRADTAATLNLSTMSDLAAVQDQLVWGLPPECATNPLCKDALVSYGITYPPAQKLDLAACDVPMAEALNGKAIDIGWFCSTQPAIAQFGFVRLEDDKGTQPAENIAPLVRNDLLGKLTDAAGFAALLDAVSARVTTGVLTNLGIEVAVNNKDIADVATTFLYYNGW
jgi:osmoprotectant transport system substrate-binding protein